MQNKNGQKKITVSQIIIYILVAAMAGYILYMVINTSLQSRVREFAQKDVHEKYVEVVTKNTEAAKMEYIAKYVSIKNSYFNNQAVYTFKTEDVAGVDTAKNKLELEMRIFAVGNQNKEYGLLIWFDKAKYDKVDFVEEHKKAIEGKKQIDVEKLETALFLKVVTKGGKTIFTLIDPSAPVIIGPQKGDIELNRIEVLHLNKPKYNQQKQSLSNIEEATKVMHLASVDGQGLGNPADTFIKSNLKAEVDAKYKEAFNGKTIPAPFKPAEYEKAGQVPANNIVFVEANLAAHNAPIYKNVAIYVVILLVVVYVLFVHKPVMAAIARKKQQKQATEEKPTQTTSDFQDVEFTENSEEK